MPESLHATLERTGFRASLASEYLAGHAPGTQHKDRHLSPEKPTYYELPAIKKPAWEWHVPTYFFVGGVASGAYIVAVLLDMLGREEDRPLVRAGHFVSFVGAIISPILLILDLGRPDRFLNMLRVYRPRSMMNQGTYVLIAMGIFGGAGAVAQALQMLAPRHLATKLVTAPLRVLSWLGIIPAMFLGSYTAQLLSATNVPLWAANRLLMGPLFSSSALSTGLAATHLAARLFGSLSGDSEKRLKQAESMILGVELAVTAGSGLLLRGLARPLVTGRLGLIYQVGSIALGMLAPLALSRSARQSSVGSLISPLLTLVGGAIMRFAITKAGMRSADDPRAYFAYTRPGR
jgi:formate-dependent nitrite reductase membrane component NrfD